MQKKKEVFEFIILESTDTGFLSKSRFVYLVVFESGEVEVEFGIW